MQNETSSHYMCRANVAEQIYMLVLLTSFFKLIYGISTFHSYPFLPMLRLKEVLALSEKWVFFDFCIFLRI